MRISAGAYFPLIIILNIMLIFRRELKSKNFTFNDGFNEKWLMLCIVLTLNILIVTKSTWIFLEVNR